MIRKYLFKTLVLFGFLSAIISCTSEENKGDTFDPAFYQADKVHVESTYKGCAAGSEDCTYMTFDYPAFKNADQSAVLKKLNKKVVSILLYATESSSPKAACDRFVSEFEAFVNDPETEGYEGSWFDERTATWLSIEKKVLSIKFRMRSYMGGAHENSFVALRNFNPYTGDSLGLGMIFKPESLKELSRLGEKLFREKQHLSAGVSYEDAGYWFEDNRFYLTGNFAFTDEGLLFYYNEYEIAPYSMGAIYFVVPYSLIMHLFE